jgi:flagella basal body P-ring formation protein FlgA
VVSTFGNISANRAGFGRHFPPLRAYLSAYSARMVHFVRLLACLLLGLAAHAHAQVDPALQQQVREFALAGTRNHAAPRIEVIVGELDPRLRLAPCEQVEPYLLNAAPLWGRTRIGIRCLRGPSRWNVFLPVTVKVYGRALVATGALPAGGVLTADDLAQADVDLAEDASAALTQDSLAVGRTLTRPLAAGQSLRRSHLKARQWFAAGETVQVIAAGPGFRVGSEGQALTQGVEGQPARVKTEGGRVLTGMPVAERRLEVPM